MARRSKASFEKRAREKKKADKAAQKRETRQQRTGDAQPGSPPVATADDLAGYGLISDESSGPQDDPRGGTAGAA